MALPHIPSASASASRFPTIIISIALHDVLSTALRLWNAVLEHFVVLCPPPAPLRVRVHTIVVIGSSTSRLTRIAKILLVLLLPLLALLLRGMVALRSVRTLLTVFVVVALHC